MLRRAEVIGICLLVVTQSHGQTPSPTSHLAAAPGAMASRNDVATLRVIHPEEQLRRVLALFEGARAPHPAAALAAWKQAHQGRSTLSKGAEAAIAAVNPEMVPECRSLDQASLTLTVDPATGQLHWRARVPNDDGSLGAVASALALTEGVCLEPIADATVLRLGPPGSAYAATRSGDLVLSSRLEDLERCLKSPDGPRVPDEARPTPGESGWSLRFHPTSLATLTALPARRIAAGLTALGCRTIEGWATVADETLRFETTATLDHTVANPRSIDPAWLEPIEEDGLLGLVTLAIGPGSDGIDPLFLLADRVEKADPAMAKVAPVRLRLNLIAAAAGVRPEVDLWPLLRGLTAVAFSDESGQIDSVGLGFHTPDPASARKLSNDVLPRLAAGLGRKPQPGQPETQGGTIKLGAYQGRDLTVRAQGATAWVCLGSGIATPLKNGKVPPARSVAKRLRSTWGNTPPARAGVVWPGRWSQLTGTGAIVAAGLRDAPPCLWVGRDVDAKAVDTLIWPGLHATVVRALASVPLEPPPDRATTVSSTTPPPPGSSSQRPVSPGQR